MNNEDLVDLGWMNCWGSDQPQKYQDCVKRGHEPGVVNTGRNGSVQTYTCTRCNIQWKADSGD